MADCFVDAFASVYVSNLPANDSRHQACTAVSGPLIVDSARIRTILSSLDPNSSMGDDGMHPRLLRTLADVLCYPISLIFESSLREGALPDEWLVSTVVPIYKSGGREDPLKYRPIALTSVACKAVERGIVHMLTVCLNSNSILTPNQFGFRSQHSTLDQLILTYNYVTAAVDSGSVVDLIFFDYKKAFDRVNHAVLLEKLSSLGVEYCLVRWIGVFLQSRSMHVKVAGQSSHSVPVASGVAQGSVLGPTLFLIYVNHVVSDLDCEYKLFTDDTKLYLSFDVEDCASAVLRGQSNIDKLVAAGESLGLEMNVSKCVCVHFFRKSLGSSSFQLPHYTINDSPIRVVTSHKDLGVLVDDTLKFHPHINNVVCFANNLTTNILSSTLCRESEFVLNIYLFHIRPLLEYGCCLWNTGYMGDLRLLERVQRRWTRCIRGLEELPYEERLSKLNLFSLQGRLLRADLILTYKIFHSMCAIAPGDVFNLATGS